MSAITPTRLLSDSSYTLDTKFTEYVVDGSNNPIAITLPPITAAGMIINFTRNDSSPGSGTIVTIAASSGDTLNWVTPSTTLPDDNTINLVSIKDAVNSTWIFNPVSPQVTAVISFSSGTSPLTISNAAGGASDDFAFIGQGVGATGTTSNFASPSEIQKTGIAVMIPRNGNALSYDITVTGMTGTIGSTCTVTSAIFIAASGSSTSFLQLGGTLFSVFTIDPNIPASLPPITRTVTNVLSGVAFSATNRVIIVVRLTGVGGSPVNTVDITANASINFQ
jgi:hypothetical protein